MLLLYANEKLKFNSSSVYKEKLKDYQSTMQTIKDIGYILSMLKGTDDSFEDEELKWTNNKDIKKLL